MGGNAGLAVNVSLFKKLTYDPVKDFEPVALILRVPFILVVNPSLPVRTVADLIALVKQKQGQFLYASAGIGTQPHLAMEILKSMTGMDMVHVPYKGAMIGLRDVVAGRVPIMFVDPASALPQIRAGNVRALGVSSTTRVTSATEIPTIAEAGFPGFEAVVWIMVVVPAKTPKEIVNKLHIGFKSILALPDVQQKIASFGVRPVDSPTLPELHKFLTSEMARWGRVVRRAGLAGLQ